jgi:hypothetical protein
LRQSSRKSLRELSPGARTIIVEAAAGEDTNGVLGPVFAEDEDAVYDLENDPIYEPEPYDAGSISPESTAGSGAADSIYPVLGATEYAEFSGVWDGILDAATDGMQDCWYRSSAISFEGVLDSPDILGLISSPPDSCPHTTAIALGEVRGLPHLCVF